ncbi:GntR family transcriptional regulator [Rhizobium sp. SSA_523]|uniref:GntR family transcriptional regulator n=1 Tax=Rhizobium sp. SSA_523 TaxID=2952477 RepID=UPI0020902DB8|nr:GntR family transcriptional regulator [Rhizobium sp. SSA_523]MCO5734277.1 GntR family transcriptional regulator [Rhizobium sp. SSA_523]WKC21451.1 GntR family transcriptional regulator [Rhizobium sp. SSA_523]
MQPIPPTTAPKLYRRACDRLAREISSGLIAAGTRLTETAVAERFAISRAPARQALAELEERGLVRKAQGRGYEVETVAADPRAARAEPVADAIVQELQPHASWELIYPDVEIEVVSRTAMASWRINEALLARHFGVSRTVAREVVARLQERGIVRKDASARWIAPALTERHINELYELRWVLEPLALAKAVPLLPQGCLARLRRHLEEAVAAQRVDSDRLDQLEQELHVDLLGYCGNHALLRAVSLPQALLVAHHFLYRRTADMFESEPFLPEHLKVVECLERQDVDAACEALADHLKVSRHRAMLRIRAVADVITPVDLPYLERL